MTSLFTPFGSDLFGNPIEQTGRGPLAESFVMPPFSVLDARSGDWQERKRAWLSLGIESEIGRATELQPTGKSSVYGGTSSWAEQRGGAKTEDGTTGGASVFDPVLAELAYRWWCPEGGQILDPFAGGSVRGVIAGLLGFKYWGCDLRAEQIQANQQQKAKICPDAAVEWECGDCLALFAEGRPPRWADFVFTCPPYGDLERYSADPRDLSTMEYRTFIEAWARVFALCEFRLKPNRFMAVVIGDFRDDRFEFYRGFVADTVTVARLAGLSLYNDAVLVTPVGSLCLRAPLQFPPTRKLGKSHQNVLVFAKGSPSWMK